MPTEREWKPPTEQEAWDRVAGLVQDARGRVEEARAVIAPGIVPRPDGEADDETVSAQEDWWLVSELLGGALAAFEAVERIGWARYGSAALAQDRREGERPGP